MGSANHGDADGSTPNTQMPSEFLENTYARLRASTLTLPSIAKISCREWPSLCLLPYLFLKRGF